MSLDAHSLDAHGLDPALPAPIRTERLVLRPPAASDFAPFAAFNATDRMVFIGGPRTPLETWRWLCYATGHHVMRGFGPWMIEDAETGALLGRAGLHRRSEWPTTEIVWTLFDAGLGRGLATEAAAAALVDARARCGVGPVVALINPANARSVAVARRLGAVHEPEGWSGYETAEAWRLPGEETAAPVSPWVPRAPAGETIETERLILRPLSPADAPHYARIFADLRSRYIGGPGGVHLNWAGMCRVLGAAVLRGMRAWSAWERDGGAFAGQFALDWPPVWDAPELGWTLASGFEGRGLATEGAAALRAHAREALGADAVVSFIHEDNHASQAVARRLGATRTSEVSPYGAPVLVWRHPGGDA